MAPALACPGPVVAEATVQPLRLESVYREHFKSVWRILRRLGVAPSQLDDAAQDVFLVVFHKLANFDARAPLRSWVFAIAVRVASDYRRRALRNRAEPLHEAIPDVAANPALRAELQEDVRLLHELLSELDDKKRTVFVLSELEQLSVPEIAHVLGVNLNTVYSRLRSSKQRFEAALARRRAARPPGGWP
jgi:RNA polymerase sigma-70 factor, ECF subfamily